jgi:hypothetical protein
MGSADQCHLGGQISYADDDDTEHWLIEPGLPDQRDAGSMLIPDAADPTMKSVRVVAG